MDTITKQNIDEIRTLSAPPQLVKDALGAIFLLLGYSSAQATDWKLIRKELGKRSTDDNSILNQLKNFQAEKCDPASAKKAKELIGDVTIAQAKSVSLVASHFVAWTLNALNGV
ncbi:cytoplasmic dynein 2 heavy chain 1-like [Ostrea edulis]|uniref:cytoplasmic dynein 2 heavy chain 1-like n=1 Tax=Ostrea edulis TaxID=37623 RepID=UPI002094E4BF|nr:cytoplasmic dynein 2 heavy chain 1-like [Ostrea edulis]